MAMTEQDILTGLAEIVEEFLDVPADKVTMESSLADDLDVDSLSMIEIAASAQDKFGVKIPDDELKHLRTVQDVVCFVQRSAELAVPARSLDGVHSGE
jgi:acyl carrier protein